MKLFSEFGSCWGGAIISPEAAAASEGRQTAERGVHYKRVKVRPGGCAVNHWHPKLNAISENSPMAEANSGGGNSRPAGMDRNKKSVKVKPKSPAKASPALNHADTYWRSYQAMALPAFSPTSFSF